MLDACRMEARCQRRQVLQIIDMIGACQGKVRCLKRRQVLQIIDVIGACQVKVKCFKRHRLNELSTRQVHVG